MPITTEDKETLQLKIDALLKDVTDEDMGQIEFNSCGTYCSFEHKNKYNRYSGTAFHLSKDYDYDTLKTEIDCILNPMLLFEQRTILKIDSSRL